MPTRAPLTVAVSTHGRTCRRRLKSVKPRPALLSNSGPVSTVEHEARKSPYCPTSLSALLETLSEVRLCMVLRPSGKKGGRPRAEWQLEDSNGEALQLFRAIVPNRPPFVYTDGRE